MLTFNDKNSTLRKRIHSMAQDIYENLAFGKQLDQEFITMATQMTFHKPISEDPQYVPQNTKQNQPQSSNQPTSAAMGVLTWIDNSDSEDASPSPQNEPIRVTEQIHPQVQNEEQSDDNQDLGPDPFEDFVGYDPFEDLVVPENFSTKFMASLRNESSNPQSNAFF